MVDFDRGLIALFAVLFLCFAAGASVLSEIPFALRENARPFPLYWWRWFYSRQYYPLLSAKLPFGCRRCLATGWGTLALTLSLALITSGFCGAYENAVPLLSNLYAPMCMFAVEQTYAR